MIITYVALLETCLHAAEGVSTNTSSWEAKGSQAVCQNRELYRSLGCLDAEEAAFVVGW